MSSGGCEPRSDEFQFGGYRYNTQRFEQWKLPRSLREISGLAQTDDGRLFAHADERAIIHQIDYQSGKRLKSFSLSRQPGGKAIRGDFEGIAVVENQVYLVTSQGTIYISRLGMDGGAESFQAHSTGLAEVCEVEGLAYHRNLHTLLLACKSVRGAELRGKVVIFQWSLDRQALVRDATISIPLATIAIRLGGSNRFNPSGIAVSPRNGNLVIVAAQQRALLEITMAGDLVNVFTLPMQRYHRQTEGIALFANGTLILADEGGSKRGRLGVYRAD
ncbi:MAG: hypothetical protein O7B25_07290 [Gammaproteobacteria bacterium]|nr:hypothetical protein [Gammaproteobacteria bacterium]